MLTITSKENPQIKNMLKLLSSAKERREQERFAVEGVRLCLDAVRSKTQIEQVFITRQACEKYPEAVAELSACAEQCVCITEEIARKISDTKSPQGVFSVCRALDKKADMVHINKNSRIVVLENMQDPSNLGAVLRCAEAFGVQAVILAGACCDAYAPKAARASMGAIFRLNLLHCETGEQAARLLHAQGVCTFAAVAGGDAQPVERCGLGAGCAVFIGNEGNGLTAQTIHACEIKMTIPMPGRAESLNAAVAAGILIWEMIRGKGE